MASTKKLTVVICTYNRHIYLESLLESLLGNDNGATNVILVDNSTSDNEKAAIEQVASKYNRIDLLYSEPGKLSVARNVGLNACSTPYISYIDDDAEPCDKWAYEICSSLDQCGKHVAAVGGPIIPHFVSPRPSWLSNGLLGMLGALDFGDAERILEPNEFIYGGNMAFRIEALAKIGGFDESLGRLGSKILLGNEDIEVQRRLREHSSEILYSPNMKIFHIAHQDRLNQQWFFRRIIWQAITETLEQNPPTKNDLLNHRKYLREISSKLDVSDMADLLLSKTETEELFEQKVWFLFSLLKLLLNGSGQEQ